MYIVARDTYVEKIESDLKDFIISSIFYIFIIFPFNWQWSMNGKKEMFLRTKIY